MTTPSNLLPTLHEQFGFHNFRPGQEAAITHLLAGQHALVVMPTGAGKSLIYQLAACLLPHTALVISPLIALPDKLRALREFLVANPDAGIIYVGTRREAEEVADFVREVVGREARAYHAGLEDALRAEIQDAFMSGRLDLVVATNAFGMGVDRADVRFVAPLCHSGHPGGLLPGGRSGRPGRGGARCVLLYAPQDRALQEWFIENDGRMTQAPPDTAAGDQSGQTAVNTSCKAQHLFCERHPW